MTCPDCERYKESAKNWRHKAYELSGHPLPWERGDTWVGLMDEEIKHLWYEACQTNLELTSQLIVHLARNIEAKLKEKNGL